MVVVNVSDNGLNVQYVSKFIEKEHADRYFTELKTLPFYVPTFKIHGKYVQSKRRVLAYGDTDLSYAFSGTSIPWTSLMLELRNRVEKFAACSFNYVLLNLYTDGNSYISQHKDVESGLDAPFPIVVLSFGAERIIEFKKPQTPSTYLKLEHGSLYSMLEETNKLFSHGIVADKNIKEMRISLTFRHLLTIPASVKRPRLQNTSPDSEKDGVSSASTNANEKDSLPSTNNVCEKDFVSNVDKNNLGDQEMNPLIKQWNLNGNTLLQIMLNSNYKLRLHIRAFKETTNGLLLPTKKGIAMTLNTWSDFIGKIANFKFQSVKDSFISNNQLLVISVSPDFCVFQQIFPLNSLGFFLKPTILKLYNDQVCKLRELLCEISETIIHTKLLVQLPQLILNSRSLHEMCTCFAHLTLENAKQNFFECLTSEIISSTYKTIHCDACITMPANQNLHDCIKPIYENFIMNRVEILLNFNLMNVVKNLVLGCSCHYTVEFFKQLNMEMFEQCFEEILSKHKPM